MQSAAGHRSLFDSMRLVQKKCQRLGTRDAAGGHVVVTDSANFLDAVTITEGIEMGKKLIQQFDDFYGWILS